LDVITRTAIVNNKSVRQIAQTKTNPKYDFSVGIIFDDVEIIKIIKNSSMKKEATKFLITK
tara:strand:- start:261 stop:443 length:183 start_codon:yes stop_codon:yes gene_type:complete